MGLPWPFQSVFAGPPKMAAHSASDLLLGAATKVLQIGGSSVPVKSTTALTLGASSEWV
jgi:hypothetical protein